MFGFRLIHRAELEKIDREHDLLLRVADNEIKLVRKHMEMLDKELAYYRTRADEERQRADRLNDALLQQNGLPETTSTVIREKAERKNAADEEFERRQQYIGEMFAEELHTNYDEEGLEDLGLPADLAAAADQLMGQVKSDAKR